MALPADASIVITGGSSGVGRTAALAFAARGARIVVAGRDIDALEETAQECRGLGTTCTTYALDVTDPVAVDQLARHAVKEFGSLDVWVNCAAVISFGPFEAMPVEEFHRVVAVNLFGYVHGGYAALRQFRAQGGRGVLINVSSMLGVAAEPYASSYVASKFAIRGWSASVRQELIDVPGIHVCTVLPAALDTPVYQRAANHMGRRVRAIFPVYDVRRVAGVIVRLADRPRAEVVVSGFGHLISIGSRVAPRLLELIVARAGPRLQFENRTAPDTTGVLFGANHHAHMSEGGWRGYWREKLSGRKRRKADETPDVEPH